MKGPASKHPAGLFWYKTSEIYNNKPALLPRHGDGVLRHGGSGLYGWVCLLEGVVLGMIQLFIDHPTLGLKHSLHSMGQHYFGIGRVKNIQNSDPLLI
jgi:hypothetical protein